MLKMEEGGMGDGERGKVGLVENFSVFGVTEKVVMDSAREVVEGMVVTSMNKATEVEEQTAKMVFPSGAMIKRIYG